MLDTLLVGHLLLQLVRLAAAAALLLALYGLGTLALRRVTIDDTAERTLLAFGAGFAIFQCVVRWCAEVPYLGLVSIAAMAAVGAPASRWLARQLPPPPPGQERERTWRAITPLAFLLLAPLAMAFAPAVSQDAMIYHLRFPELTLRQGTWAYDPANSASFYPSAMSTLYLGALAVDGQGVAAQLVHFGFYVLLLGAVAALARRLGAPTGLYAAVLLAALPAAAIVAGWSWSDIPLLFALATAVLAMFNRRFALALALLGLAASIKYTALLAGLPIGLALLIVAVRARAWRSLAYGIPLAIAVASPWYVTNALRTGNPVYPLASGHRATSVFGSWSGASWIEVWSGYFLRPQTLDEDIGGILFLVLAAVGLTLAVRSPRTRPAALVTLAMWVMFLPYTTAMRLLLPAAAATIVVAGAALERTDRKAAIALVAVFALRGGAITAAHNARFMNPVPAAVGLEQEADYVARNFPPAALYARAAAKLPPNARVVAVNEVRLFRFPRPVSVARNVDPPLLGRYTGGAAGLAEVLARFRRDGVTHLLIAPRPVERGANPRLPRREERLVTEVVRASTLIDREGDTLLFALPATPPPVPPLPASAR